MFKGELLNVVSQWTVEQLDIYIKELETRITDTQMLLKELRLIRKKKNRKTYDNGTLGGKG